MSAASKAILTNREVIAIDQDPLGAEATRLSHDGDADVWTRTLANGDRAVMLLNRGTVPLSIGTDAQALGLPDLRRVPHPRPVGAHLDGVGRPDRRVRARRRAPRCTGWRRCTTTSTTTRRRRMSR